MDVRRRLEAELERSLERIRQSTGETLTPSGSGSRPTEVGTGDAMDAIQASVDRELGFATRSLLVRRANELAEALERLRRGDYGDCLACGRPIAAARLAAAPEATMCVSCQEGQERKARYRHAVGAAAEEVDE